MITYQVFTDGNKISEDFNEDKPTLKESALIVYRLTQIINYLQSKEFESEFEIKQGDFVDDGA